MRGQQHSDESDDILGTTRSGVEISRDLLRFPEQGSDPKMGSMCTDSRGVVYMYALCCVVLIACDVLMGREREYMYT